VQTKKARRLAVASVVLVTIASAIIVFVSDPTTTMRLKNDYATPVTLSFCGGTSAAPGQEVSAPMSIFNSFPCFVYEEEIDGGQGTYVGCLRFDPLVDHETVLSAVVSHLSQDRCWATAPR